MKTISATFNFYIEYEILDDVYAYLQPQPYGKDLKAIGRWFILNHTFYYNDKEGIEREIKGDKPKLDCEVMKLTNDEDEIVYNDE